MPIADTPGADDTDKADDPLTADDKRQGPGTEEKDDTANEGTGGLTE
jgi:hypothetical protein